MLLLVFTLVEAPSVGWLSVRTLGSFVARRARSSPRSSVRERRTRRRRSSGSASSARARSSARTSPRWRCSAAGSGSSSSRRSTCSSCAAGRRSRPGSRSSRPGCSSPSLSPRIAPLIGRFGVSRLIVAGMVSIALGYVALPADRPRLELRRSAMLPTFLLAGIGFALAFGPLNVAAHERRRARGAGARRRAAEHVVPVRRRARARGRDRRQQRQRRRGRNAAGTARRLPRGDLRLA